MREVSVLYAQTPRRSTWGDEGAYEGADDADQYHDRDCSSHEGDALVLGNIEHLGAALIEQIDRVAGQEQHESHGKRRNKSKDAGEDRRDHGVSEEAEGAVHIATTPKKRSKRLES